MMKIKVMVRTRVGLRFAVRSVTCIEQGGGVHLGVLGFDVPQQITHRGQHGRQSETTLLTCREAQREDWATEAVTNIHI